MTSSPHGPYAWGFTRVQWRYKSAARGGANLKNRSQFRLRLQLECMKSESLVIVDQHATVNTFPGLVHTARHTMKACLPEVGSLTAGGA